MRVAGKAVRQRAWAKGMFCLVLSCWVGMAQAGGREVFLGRCAVCHQADGQGTPAFAPPLTQAPARFAANEKGRHFLVSLMLYGMYGPIQIDGKSYNGVMPGFSQLSNNDLAAVLNYLVFELAKSPESDSVASVARFMPGDIAALRSKPETPAAIRQRRAEAIACSSSRVNYTQHCMGCHGEKGAGLPGKVPALRNSLGYFALLPEGRDFLIRVPGAAGSALSDADLAGVTNYILSDMNREVLPRDFAFYDVEEVSRHRARPLTDVAGYRAALVKKLRQRKIATLQETY